MAELSKIYICSGSQVVWLGDSRFAVMSGEFLRTLENYQELASGKIPFQIADKSLRVICPVFHDATRYRDEVIVMRESDDARLLAWIYRNWLKHIEKLGKIEARLFGVKEGEQFPKYTLTGLSASLLFDRFNF
jgi:hypothetical protein